METLIKIQNELKVPKGNLNKFGNYKYRSAEDILEAAKPILLKYGARMLLSDNIESHGSKLFLKASASLIIGDKVVCTYGFAELGEHKGMSSEQCTGTASSYARKYALNGLFLIDETESDADSQKPLDRKEEKELNIVKKNEDEMIMLTEEQFLRAMDSTKAGILATLKAYNGMNGKNMSNDYRTKLTAQMANVR